MQAKACSTGALHRDNEAIVGGRIAALCRNRRQFLMGGVAVMGEGMREDTRALREQAQLPHPRDLFEEFLAVAGAASARLQPKGVVEDRDIEAVRNGAARGPRLVWHRAGISPVEERPPLPL